VRLHFALKTLTVAYVDVKIGRVTAEQIVACIAEHFQERTVDIEETTVARRDVDGVSRFLEQRAIALVERNGIQLGQRRSYAGQFIGSQPCLRLNVDLAGLVGEVLKSVNNRGWKQEAPSYDTS
jgi:hypothetical protein